MGAVRPGFADEQARGVIVAPRSDVPVRASRGVGGDVARVLPERGEAYHPVRLVVAEEQGLGPRSPLRRVAAPEVVAVAGRVAQGVGDDGRLVKPGAVGGRSRVARRVRHRNGAPGDIGFRRGRVAPAVRAGVDDAGFRVGAGMRGRDARMVRLRGGEPVNDRGRCYDIGSGNAAFLRPDGARAVFAPLFGSVSSGVDGNDFAFQYR